MPIGNVCDESSSVYYNYYNMNTNNVNSSSQNFVQQWPDHSFQTTQQAVQPFTQYTPKRTYAHNPYASNLLQSEDKRYTNNQYQALQSNGYNLNSYVDQEYVNTNNNNINNVSYSDNIYVDTPIENSNINQSQ